MNDSGSFCASSESAFRLMTMFSAVRPYMSCEYLSCAGRFGEM